MMTAGASISATPTTLAGSAEGATLRVTVDVSGGTVLNRWAYGWVTRTNTSGDGRPNLRLPVAVYSTPFADSTTEATLSGVERAVTSERGFFDVDVGGMVTLPDPRFRTTVLAPVERTSQTIPRDPTNGDPYDGTFGTYKRMLDIPATAATTKYRISATTAAATGDVDLFVGRDLDNDGVADASEELCRSGSPTSSESCVIEGSHSAAAKYWVLVQNWSGTCCRWRRPTRRCSRRPVRATSRRTRRSRSASPTTTRRCSTASAASAR